MIGHSGAPAALDQPKIDRPRLLETQNHAHHMDDRRQGNHPQGTKDEEGFSRKNAVEDEVAVRHSGKRLRARERHE